MERKQLTLKEKNDGVFFFLFYSTQIVINGLTHQTMTEFKTTTTIEMAIYLLLPCIKKATEYHNGSTIKLQCLSFHFMWYILILINGTRFISHQCVLLWS